MFQNPSETVTDMVTKAGPALAVSGLTFFGISLPDLVQLLTGIYVLLMACDKAYMIYLRYKKDKQGVDEPQE